MKKKIVIAVVVVAVLVATTVAMYFVNNAYRLNSARYKM